MKRILGVFILVVLGVLVSTSLFAQARIESQPFGGKMKVEGFGEYIHFVDSDIDASSWGGGILARYLFNEWIGTQLSFTYYGDADTNKLGGDLSFYGIRFSILLHTYVTGTDGVMPLYVYGGAGVGGQFNSEVGSVEVNDAVLGHVLGGVGYDFAENFFIEAEGGYQFGNAGVSNYTKSNIGLEAYFIRAGIGAKF